MPKASWLHSTEIVEIATFLVLVSAVSKNQARAGISEGIELISGR